QAGKDGSCFDRFSPCLSQFYCWLPRRIRQQRRGYASGGIFTTAEADFTTTESTRQQVPCRPGELSRHSHMMAGLYANMYPASNQIHCKHAPRNEGWRCFVRGGPCHIV